MTNWVTSMDLPLILSEALSGRPNMTAAVPSD